MSIIQSIRDKAAWLVSIIIALSLIGFILMDAGKSRTGLFGSSGTVVGEVNGNKLELKDFDKRITQVKAQYQAYNYPIDDQGAREQAWNAFIAENLVDDECDKAGLAVTAKERDYLLYENPSEDLKQAYKSQQTGAFDPNLLRQQIAELKRRKDKDAMDRLNEYLLGLSKNRLQQKFSALIANTAYYPKWMLEKLNSDNNSLAAVSYVNVPYTTISDSAVKVSDEDIAAFVAKHPGEYKQEESRSIAYVAFDASPSSADSTTLYKQLQTLKPEFTSIPADEVNAFLARNGSQTHYADMYVLKSKLQVPNADSIRNLADGAVFGPYIDGGSYSMAKMIGKRNMPDSVKCRHILISTQGGLPDSTAKKRADSIATAIKGGADFAALAKAYSDDAGSKEKGGEYEFGSMQAANLAKEFAETIFYGNAGDKKVVKTSFGYHYIEVLSQKNFETAYKVEYLSKPIVASQETDDRASGLANQFASESRNAKAFEANLKKRNYNKLLAGDIKPNDANIMGLGTSRQLVRWLYGAGRGDVSEVFDLDNKYAVAMVTEVNKEGVMSPAKARPLVEYIVRNQKKAEVIRKKLGSAATLEAASAAAGQPVLKTDSLSFANPFFPNAGQEGKVGGYAFNAQAKGKVSPAIGGNGGVYVIRTDNIYAKANEGADVAQQRQMMLQNQRMATMNRGVIETALKKAASIKDNRNKFF